MVSNLLEAGIAKASGIQDARCGSGCLLRKSTLSGIERLAVKPNGDTAMMVTDMNIYRVG